MISTQRRRPASAILQQIRAPAHKAGQSSTYDHIQEATRHGSAEVYLAHQQTPCQRSGSADLGVKAKHSSPVVPDAAAGVVEICHGIEKADADACYTFWSGGGADGVCAREARTRWVD